MTLVDDWALAEDDDEFPYTVDANGYAATAADWELDCTNDNAVGLASRGRVFVVPARCKKLRECLSCRDWWWTRQRDHITTMLTRDEVEKLYVAQGVTDRELSAATDIRQKMGSNVDWAWANTPEGRTYIATKDVTQVRGRRFPQGRMKTTTIEEGLIMLGDTYLRAETSRRQPCAKWRVPVRSFLLGFGNRDKMDRIINALFPDGDAWDGVAGRQLTPREIIARFSAAYADM